MIKSRLISAVLLATAILVSSIMAWQAQSATRDELDESWRGSYDLLVTATSLDSTLTDEFERSLVDSNFGNVSGEPIPHDLVDAVASLSRVEVSAPVGLLGRYGNTLEWARLEIPLASLSRTEAESFTIDWRVTSNDGLGTRLAQVDTIDITVDLRQWDGQSEGTAQETGLQVTGSVPAFDPVVFDGVLSVSLLPLPVASTTVFAIDPEAERALLGPDGAFLDPLISAQDRLHGMADGAVVTAGEVVDSGEPEDGLWSVEDLNAAAEGTSRYLFDTGRGALTGMYGWDNPLTPYLMFEDAYPPLTLTTAIQRVDSDSQPVGAPIAASTDISAARWPFTGSSIVLPWVPEVETTYPSGYVMADVPTGVSSLRVSAATPGSLVEGLRPRITLTEPDMVPAVPALAPANPDGTGIGQESAYRDTTGVTPHMRLGTFTSPGAAPLAVGTYGAVATDGNAAAYVPLGAYDPSLVHAGNSVLEPTLHGLGIAGQPASALVTLAGAREAFGVENPATAIRVRVAGLDGYDSEARQSLSMVRSQIEALGLHVVEVAGSSPQTVDVDVPDYAFGTTDSDTQVVAPLRDVTTDFTTLSAAQSAQGQADDVQRIVLIVSLGATAGAVVLIWLLGLPERRRADLVLRALGLRARDRLGWHLRRDAAPLLLVGATSLLAGILAPVLRMPLVAVGTLAVVTMVGCAVAAALHTASTGRGLRQRRAPAHGAANGIPPTRGVVLRRVVGGTRVLLLLCGAGTAVLSTATALAVTALFGAREGLATTRLGSQVADAFGPALVVVLVATAVSGAVLTLQSGTLAGRRLAPALRVMRDVAGYTSRARARVLAAALALSGVLAAAVVTAALVAAVALGAVPANLVAVTISTAFAGLLLGVILLARSLHTETP
ncbi:MAG: hypothetical protein Q4G34_07175 [Micrococcus sp.]|nr:hypothetical protein [Micrococcus sp.]